MNFVKRFLGHLKTVHKHRKMVRKLCFKCGLYWQGLTHDLSKYSYIEFWRGVKYFTGKGSPHIGERAEYGYSEAWIHHHNRNKHHAEYWCDIKDGKSVPISIPLKYLAEMICDRVAASKVYLGEQYTDSAPFDYYMTHRDENQFNLDTRFRLEHLLQNIKLSGLDVVLADIKHSLNS